MPVPVLPPIDDSFPNPAEEGTTAGPPPGEELGDLRNVPEREVSAFARRLEGLVAGNWPVPGVGSTYSWGIAYVPTWRNLFAEAGLYVVDRASQGDPAAAEPGDAILYDWPGSPLAHIGLFDSEVGDGSILVWEGNTSDALMLKRRTRGVVNGVARVPFVGMAQRQAALDFYRARDGMAEYPPGSNCNEITAACGLGCVAWCAETASLAIVQGFGTTVGAEGPAPYTPPPPGSSGDFLPLDVDGGMGPLTTRALQHNLGVDADGAFGPLSKRALQGRVGTEQDGQIGPVTVSALQERVGAAVDGDWQGETTSALQRSLNAHRF